MIHATKESLFLCLPLLQPDVIKAIKQLRNEKQNVRIQIGLDFSPETFRQGYGEIDSYKEINHLAGIGIYNLVDNRVSFIISDSVGYYLFIESLYFIPADKSTLNAVSIDLMSMVRLKQQFFKSFQSESDYQNEIANAVLDESQMTEEIKKEFSKPTLLQAERIDSAKLNTVRDDLAKNPPIKPDYKRLVNVYSSKLQYVKLEVTGGNLETKKINLPSDALPVKNANLKKQLETKLNLFDNVENNEIFNDIKEFKKNVESLRVKYLVPLKHRDVSIIKKENKLDFENKLQKLQTELQKLSFENGSKLDTYIDKSKQRLITQLTDFFINNKDELFGKNNLFRQVETDDEITLKAENKA